MELLISRQFDYQGIGKCPSKCLISIWTGKKNLVLFTELNENKGTSVTNWSESLAKSICTKYKLVSKSTRFFENYQNNPKEYSEIRYAVKDGEFLNPSWTYMFEEEFKALLKLK